MQYIYIYIKPSNIKKVNYNNDSKNILIIIYRLFNFKHTHIHTNNMIRYDMIY